MQQLPQDVLGLILGFMDAKSHARFSATCKRARLAVSGATKLSAALRTADEAARLALSIEAPAFEAYARGISRAFDACAKRKRGSPITEFDIAMTKIIKRREDPPTVCDCLAGCSRAGTIRCTACHATVCREHAEPFFCESCKNLGGCDVCGRDMLACDKCGRTMCQRCTNQVVFGNQFAYACASCMELIFG